MWGEHGFSLHVQAGGKQLLMDTGQSGQVLMHNLRALGIDPAGLDGLVLSHGHDDHTGGIRDLLPSLRRVPLWAHPDVFRQKYSGQDEHPSGIGNRREELSDYFDLRLSVEAQEVAPGVWTSGEIRERPYPEGRGKSHVVRGEGGFIPDPYSDDLSLVVRVREGLVVICGCCHAGLLNTLDQVRGQHRGPVIAILGGTHLGSADQHLLRQVADYLQAIGSPRLYLNHCTGFRANQYLTRALPDKVFPFGVGESLEFASEALA